MATPQQIRRHGAGSKRGGQFRAQQQPEPPAARRPLADGYQPSSRRPSVMHPGPSDQSVSVSAVLNTINKPGVNRWQLGLVADCAMYDSDSWVEMDPDDARKYLVGAADRARTSATTSGTVIHSEIESLLSPEAEPPDPAERPYLAAAHAFLERFRAGLEEDDASPARFVAEVDVCSTDGGYHGRADMIVFGPDGQWHIIDWKTTAKADATGPHGDTSLQLNAYGRADGWRGRGRGQRWEALPDRPADSSWAVQLKPDGTYIAAECMSEDGYQAFLGAQAIAAWSKKQRARGHDPFSARWSNDPQAE